MSQCIIVEIISNATCPTVLAVNIIGDIDKITKPRGDEPIPLLNSSNWLSAVPTPVRKTTARSSPCLLARYSVPLLSLRPLALVLCSTILRSYMYFGIASIVNVLNLSLSFITNHLDAALNSTDRAGKPSIIHFF